MKQKPRSKFEALSHVAEIHVFWHVMLWVWVKLPIILKALVIQSGILYHVLPTYSKPGF